MGAGEELLQRIITYIIDPAVRVVFTAGLFLFLWGLVEFLWGLKEGKDQTDGKNHMIWGMVGMLIMVSVYGIIALIVNTFEINITNPDVSRVNNVQVGNPFGN
ncbi:hypothetical protein A2765_06325 [Candidatus Kaiserbacteria bacterium RIFCSPHIGHO2_01_FULL_56_24]|uniref:DUF5671 domain-containing protein n=1 Tax=Candidatus Kaiserbacteria bacterium RIFCSPHIGHO2_01_FULL_56_24 TaxID=1798487 RepID=A0A1F6DH33_9BACT|nr:MAG: hypothetical protein A2765_06325 [Candidatus Kaiserbacteria bacterium RIFCSPHIGHO2_01_FULL_56_24]